MIVMACYALNARSQTDESRNFIYLNSDSVIHADRIRLRTDFGGSLVLRADSRRVPLEQVKFFNNEDGFFANTRKTNLFAGNSFSERIVKGKINLYQEVAYDPVPFELDYYRFRDGVPRAISTSMFYNKGFSDVKKVSYASLKMDMADNPKSLDFLESYRKKKQMGAMMYVAAGVAILGSFIDFFSGDKMKIDHNFPSKGISSSGKSHTATFLLMGVSGGLVLGGYLTQASANREIEKAIDAYNRN